MSIPSSAAPNFNPGQPIEVLKKEEKEGAAVSFWLPAKVAPWSLGKRKRSMMYVEFETPKAPGEDAGTPLREWVEVVYVRPSPGAEPLCKRFNVGAVVEAFDEEKKGWRKARVLEIFENYKYEVLLTSDDENVGFQSVALHPYNSRVHRVWNDGCWVPPLAPERDVAEMINCFWNNEGLSDNCTCPMMKPKKPSSEADVASKKRLKIKIRYGTKRALPNFVKGMEVEVKGRVEQFRGAWYQATIVALMADNSFMVEYHTLKTEDETEFLSEAADAESIRPCPPIQNVEQFEPLAPVDAWYKEGWWKGHISRVMDGSNYMVCFNNTKREIVFKHNNLRPHQEWIEGQWVASSKITLTEMEENSKELKSPTRCSGNKSVQFRKGMRVEVKSDEEGYEGAWYTAVILDPADNDRFMVEYQTLKTDDMSHPLTEFADASYIRPCPPLSQRIDRYKMHEEVDAWYNEGWWVGVISKVLSGLKYTVYFLPTKEEMEFSHRDLRPHQEWIGGKWITAFKENSKLPKNSKIGKLKGQNGGGTSVAYFKAGAKVEVKSDEVGYEGSWFTAHIARYVSKGKYLVQYQTLKTDNKKEFLNDVVDVEYMRPPPPLVQQTKRFKPKEKVDAWYNEGWWVGEIKKVKKDGKYLVYFKLSNEVLDCDHADLRPHQDWINGEWIPNIGGMK